MFLAFHFSSWDPVLLQIKCSRYQILEKAKNSPWLPSPINKVLSFICWPNTTQSPVIELRSLLGYCYMHHIQRHSLFFSGVISKSYPKAEDTTNQNLTSICSISRGISITWSNAKLGLANSMLGMFLIGWQWRHQAPPLPSSSGVYASHSLGKYIISLL